MVRKERAMAREIIENLPDWHSTEDIIDVVAEAIQAAVAASHQRQRRGGQNMKRPDGALIEEYITSTRHLIEDGKFYHHVSDGTGGGYTGRFFFQHKDGKATRWYTRKTSPKWLLALYNEASGAEG